MSSTDHRVPAGPADLFRTATAFWHSRMLSVAVELDLFSVLAQAPATLAELCQRLRLHPKPTEALLNGLCALGLLEHDGELYRNGETAGNWLDRASPSYVGGLFSLAGWQFPLWTRLRTLLETGEAQGGHADFASCPDEFALRGFVEAADALSVGCGPALAAAVDWARHRRVVDLGGARGNVLAGILAAHPHLTGGSFDLPAVAPLFDEHVARLGLADRMSFHAGDFFTDDLPEADVYLLGHLLHDWDDERCAQLIARAADALPADGALLLYDTLIDPGRPETWQNWLLTLNMQLISPGGAANTTDDCRVWLERAGLVDIRVRTLDTGLLDAETLLVCRKPA